MRCRTSRPVGEPHHLLDQRLAAVVGRVRLAGHDQLDRPLLVEQQPFQAVRVAQHQGQPLVGRHPPGEPDGQHVGIESRCDPTQFGFRRAALQPRRGAAGGAHPRPAARAAASGSTTGDRDRPAAVAPRRRARSSESRPDQFAAQLQPLRRRPGRRVDAVGDRSDRHLVGVESGPQLVEHGPAHPAVQQRDAVGPLRQPQTHVGHVELRRVVLGAERDDAVQRHARQQHADSPSAARRRRRRSSAAPSRPGIGRCRRAPACAW